MLNRETIVFKVGKELIAESVTFSCRCCWDYIGEFLQLGHKKPIHIVGMRVKASRQAQRRMESTFFEPKRMGGKKLGLMIKAFQ